MKRYIVSFIIGALLLGIGSTLTVLSFYDYNYVDKLPNNIKITPKKVNLTQVLVNDKDFLVLTREAKTKIIKNDSFEKGKALIEVTYYDTYGNLRQEYDETDEYNILYLIIRPHVNNYTQVKKLIDLGIDGLKEKKIYNYSWLFRPVVNIYINPSDTNNVKVRNY